MSGVWRPRRISHAALYQRRFGVELLPAILCLVQFYAATALLRRARGVSAIARGLAAVALLGALGCDATTPSNWRSAGPHPDLGPSEVVAAQLEALRHNDKKDAGIEVAFRFASPGNRRNTGPLDRFALMIHDGPYELLLGFDAAHSQPIEVEGGGARQRVTIVRDGAVGVFLFLLSRQSDGACNGCWMTDAVFVEEDAAAEAI